MQASQRLLGARMMVHQTAS